MKLPLFALQISPSLPRDGGESRLKIGRILYLLWFVMRVS